MSADSRYWSHVHDQNVRRDIITSAMNCCFACSGFLYQCTTLWRVHSDRQAVGGIPSTTLVSWATTAVWWVFAHLLMELAFFCWISQSSATYLMHRSSCIIFLRSGIYLLILVYIPKTWKHCAVLSEQQGDANAMAMRILTVFVPMHVTGILRFRLPARIAAPYHTIRVLASLTTLPEIFRTCVRHPPMAATAHILWQHVGQLFSTAGHLVLSAPLPDHSPDNDIPIQAQACSALVFSIFLNLSVGLFVPMYVLYVWERSGVQAFLEAEDPGSSDASSNLNISSAFNDSSDSIRSLNAADGSAPLAEPLDASQFPGNREGADHSRDAASPSFLQQLAPPNNAPNSATTSPTAAVGPAVSSLRGVWPLHFTLPMHVLVMFSGCGLIWCLLSFGWALWLNSTPGSSLCLNQQHH